jgi:hypothetical protein
MLVKKEPIVTFEITVGMPLNMINTLDNWARNPVGIPPPIRDDGPSLNIIDVDVYLWVRAITPKEGKDLFTKLLWGIFAAPGRWEQLVSVQWTKKSIDSLRFATPGPFVWPGKPIDTSEMYLTTWLGHAGGVNPTFARHRIEPYAACKQSSIVAATFVHNAREAGTARGLLKQGAKQPGRVSSRRRILTKGKGHHHGPFKNAWKQHFHMVTMTLTLPCPHREMRIVS